MINLDKLNSKFDANNFSVDQIVKVLSENQKSINLVFFAVSLAVAGLMFNDYHVKEQGIRAKMSQEQTKIGAIKARDAAIQDFNNFKASLPKQLNEVDLITQISTKANLYQVTIPSLNPTDSRDMGMYDQIDVKFNGESD